MKLNNQAKRILSLLLNYQGNWVPLPEILDLRIARYGARIMEIRRAGYQVEMQDSWHGRERHTAYRIVTV